MSEASSQASEPMAESSRDAAIRAQVEAGAAVRKARRKLRKTDPVKWYLASETMIAEGLKDMIEGSFKEWYAEASKSSKWIALVVIKAVKIGFEDKLKQKKGWETWAKLLDGYGEPEAKPSVSMKGTFDANMNRRRQYVFKNLLSMPLFLKAGQARENLAKEIETSVSSAKDQLNGYAHESKRMTFGDEYNPQTPEQRYRIVDDAFKASIIQAGTSSSATSGAQVQAAPAARASDAMSRAKELLQTLKDDEDVQDNSYYRALRWSLNRFVNDSNEREKSGGRPKLIYGGKDYGLLIENDGPKGTRYCIDRWIESEQMATAVNADDERAWEQSEYGEDDGEQDDNSSEDDGSDQENGPSEAMSVVDASETM